MLEISQSDISKRKEKPIGVYLVEAGLITPVQVKLALDEQKVAPRRLGEILAARGWVKSPTIEYLMKKVVLPERRKVENKFLRKSKVLDQLVYTSFAEVGFKVFTSTHVTTEIQLAFMQQVVYQHWNSYNPPSSGYQAAYIHQVTPEHSLFGWLYNDGADDLGRSDVPYFLCYSLAEPLDAVQLENIFICLHKGPVALIDRKRPPDALETIVAPDLWSYQPARRGVAIPSSERQRSHVALKQRKLLDLFVPADKRKIVIKIYKQIYKQQSAPVEPSVTATPIPQAPPPGENNIAAFRGNSSKPEVGVSTSDASIPTSPNKSAFLIGIATGVTTALPILALPLIFWFYYFLRSPAPASKVPQYQMISPEK